MAQETALQRNGAAQHRETQLQRTAEPAETVSLCGFPMTRQEANLVRTQICPQATEVEIAWFLDFCRRHGFDPLSRQVYLLPVRGKKAIHVGIDGYRAKAEESGLWRGTLGPYWCGTDGRWVDVWLSEDAPFAARVGVLKAGCDQPFWGIAKFSERNRCAAQGQAATNWDKMPDHMLAVRAECDAFRRAGLSAIARLMNEAGIAAERDGQVVSVQEAPQSAPDPRPALASGEGDELAMLRTRARELYVEMGGDPSDKEGYAVDLNRAAGRPEDCREPFTMEQRRLVVRRFEEQLRPQSAPIEGEVQEDDGDPFADAPAAQQTESGTTETGQRTLAAVQGAETQSFSGAVK